MLAGETTAKPIGWETFAQYSVLGVAVLLFGWLLYKILAMLLERSTAELAREVARGDRLEGENRALNNAMQDKAIPALLAAANALTEVTELLRDLQRHRDNAMQDKAIPALLAAVNALTEVTELLRDQQRERDYEIRRRTGDGR
jgi:hypothetical protein